MAEQPPEAQAPINTGDIDNTGNVAVGAGNRQNTAISNPSIATNVYVNTVSEQPIISQPTSTLAPRYYDQRPVEMRSGTGESSVAEEERIHHLVNLLRAYRSLLLDRETSLPSLSILFNRAKLDGLGQRFRAVCWLVLPDKPMFGAVAQVLTLAGVNPAILQGKNSLAQAITVAKALRQHPTLLVLQGFDDAAAKSLPPDFSALIEFAVEDDIGSSTLIILSTKPSLASRGGAKLVATPGY